MTTAPRIGPHEEKLIVLLARYVRARVDQLTRHSHSPNSLRLVRKRLNCLMAAGYVDAFVGFSKTGKPPFVYSLSVRGWRYVQEHHDMPIPARWRPSEVGRADYDDYAHDLAITDLGIAIERFCREAEPYVTFVQFLHDRFLPQTKVPLPDGTSPSLRLDAFVELRVLRDGSPKQRCHLAEIDRGSHRLESISRKLIAQAHYVQGGHYQRDFGTESLTYLWVCPGGAERVRSLIKTAETTLRQHELTDFAPLFRFTPEDPATIDPVDLFTRPVWFTPLDPSPVTLLAVPRPTETIRLDRTHYLSGEAYDHFLHAIGDDAHQIAPELDLT